VFPSEPIRIVLVEDSVPDARLFRSALAQYEVAVELAHYTDGESAVRGLSLHSNLDLIVLDLNLPKLDGWQVFDHVRSNPCTQTVPTVFLTSSDLVADRLRAQRLGAAGFVTKPIGFDSYFAAVQEVMSRARRANEAQAGG
jgi:CheY-like chemotaxis protein